MNPSQPSASVNPSHPSPAVIGVDIAKHEFVARRHEGAGVLTIANEKRSILAWLATLPPGTLIGLESTGGYHLLLAELAQARGFRVYLLNPKDLRDYAAAIGTRGKTDPIDARVIARYVAREHAELRPWVPPTRAQARIASLLKRRAKLVKAKEMIRQSLAHLPGRCPEAAAALGALERLIERLERDLATAAKQLPAAKERLGELRSVPGIGGLSGIALLNVFTRHAFSGGDAAIGYSGFDPRPRDSGQKRGRRRLSKRGPAELRRLLYNAAMSASKTKTWKPFYEHQRAKGLSATAALVILARKLIRVAFALFKQGVRFDPTRVPAG